MTSNPPKKIINPKSTTRCINNFFLSGNFRVKNPNVSIGIPKIDGMKEVKELLWDSKDTAKPQAIRKIP